MLTMAGKIAPSRKGLSAGAAGKCLRGRLRCGILWLVTSWGHAGHDVWRQLRMGHWGGRHVGAGDGRHHHRNRPHGGRRRVGGIHRSRAPGLLRTVRRVRPIHRELWVGWGRTRLLLLWLLMVRCGRLLNRLHARLALDIKHIPDTHGTGRGR